MFISRIYLENFRNFKALELDLDRGFVVLAGANGAGKTNFLEGIYFGATMRRFPESDFSQLFFNGSGFFRVRLGFQDQEHEEGTSEVFSQQSDKSYKHRLVQNGRVVTRQNYFGPLQAVSFLPQDLNLLTRSPAGRRRYLDEVLTFASREYRFALSRYQKILIQRNGLLVRIRDEGVSADALPVWDEQLAEFGALITRLRRGFLKFVNANIVSTMNKLSPNLRSAAFIYQNSGEAEKELFLRKLARTAERERLFGATAVGPHRDDFQVTVSQRAVVGYVSRGQLRSITLALKILEKNYIEKALGHAPVLLLDDVFSEFDHEHQKSLLEFLCSVKQVFISTAHLEEIEKLLPENARVLTVENGQILREKETGGTAVNV